MFEMWINDLLIEVELEVKPRNRRTYIKPRYPNKVIITSPYSISKDRMIDLVKKFESYLYKHLKEKPKAIEKSDSIYEAKYTSKINEKFVKKFVPNKVKKRID